MAIYNGFYNKILLIFPNLTNSIDKFDDNFWATDQIKKIIGLGRSNFTPPLSLLSIAAVTPKEINVIIIDERLEEIDYNLDVDLVGISVVTRAASHAYDIASKFRSRNRKVILGGIHPTVMPEEAMLHCDSIVQGEGENIWPQVLSDLYSNKLQKNYKGEYVKNLDSIPFPDLTYLRKSRNYVTTNVITATRGCENNCIFCSAGFALGKKYRKHNINKIIKQIQRQRNKYVIFLDDNLGNDIDFTKDLFRSLIPLRIKWAGAISTSALLDEEIISLASNSGCISLGVGFESISPNTIKAMGKSKTNHPENYPLIISLLHKHRIPILGYFILGFDTESVQSYKLLTDFINHHAIEMPSINTLIPYPGSPIFNKLKKENRILSLNWDLYDTAGGFIVYKPKNMSREELFQSYLNLTERIYSKPSVTKRLMNVGYFDLVKFAWIIHYNNQQRRSVSIEKKQGINLIEKL